MLVICIEGHDDATAIMLAINCPEIHLLGVSAVSRLALECNLTYGPTQVHGNSNLQSTQKNAALCLYAFGAPPSVKVYPGASKPLIRPAQYSPQIHGVDGLGGVEGFPDPASEVVTSRIMHSSRAVEGIAHAIQQTWRNGSGSKVRIVACGPLTNIALFVSIYPELVEGIEEICFMGGGVGLGNRSAVAGNALCLFCVLNL
jgi:uridine nucleosidase